MSICSYCYESNIAPKHDVGHWWNNPTDIAYVCSDECRTKLKELVQNGTWMEHKPVAMFPEYHKRLEEEVKQATQNWAKSEAEIRKSGPTALTDKQFEA